MSLGFVIFVSPIWLFAVPSESTIFWREEASSWKFMNEDDSNWRSGRWSELVWDSDVETVESLRSWMSRDDFNVEKFSPGCLGGLRLEQESSPGTWQCSYSHPPLWHILICTSVQTYNRLYENVFFRSVKTSWNTYMRPREKCHKCHALVQLNKSYQDHVRPITLYRLFLLIESLSSLIFAKILFVFLLHCRN